MRIFHRKEKIMNKIKENAHIKINPRKIPDDVIKELAITFLEGARKFYANPENVKIFQKWQEKRHKYQLNRN